MHPMNNLYKILKQNLWMTIAIHYQKKALKALDNKQLRIFVAFNDKAARANERAIPGVYYSKKYLPEYLKEAITDYEQRV